MKFRAMISILVAAAFFSACSTVPLTGRQQLNMVPDTSILSMSLQEYDQFLKKNELSRDSVQVEKVKTVGHRIQKAVEVYMRDNFMEDELKNYKWEFNLIESKEINAWCMPGGKVVVYTGILPITQDETGLAVVMGHEIAHAVARHGNERMSQTLMIQMGGVALAVAMADQPEQTRNIMLGAFGAGSTVGFMLPFSRLHENEADRMGLIFMAMAGYDPRMAVDFWQRMAQQKGDKQKPPEFLSTHPSDQKRIENIQNLIPEAMTYYRKGGVR
ncbi:MAG: M48 family metallopeptidase [Desulfatirhabdiaceae bacterium]